MILVLQMAHVASSSWFEAVRTALPNAEVHHLHYLNPKTADRFAEQECRAGPTQTIANLTALRGFRARQSPNIRKEHIRNGRWNGTPVRIITAIRDPVDHAASTLFFYADFYGHTRLKLSHRDNVSPSTLAAFFVENWRAGLAGQMGPDTFEASLRHVFTRIGNWFLMEIDEVFGIDVTRFPFDRSRACLLAANGATELLCYRFEDLPADGPAWPKLAASATSFLGSSITELPQRNVTANRRARFLYDEFKKELVMPKDLLEEIYSDPVAQHFYSAAEIAAFKYRWGGGRR